MIMAASITWATAAPKINVHTSMGDFVLALDSEKAPSTVENFLSYVRSGFYSNTLFHRVINGFVIQGGGFDPDFHQKETQAPIALESKNGLKNQRYTIAMARTAVPDSATAQFYINVADNAMLDYPNPDGYGYTVFGSVVEGQAVIDAIKAVPTGQSHGMADVPQTPVVIESMTLLSSE